MLPLHIDWTDAAGEVTYSGGRYPGSWSSEDLPFGVVKPGAYSDVQTLVVRNTAVDRRLALSSQGVQLQGAAEQICNLRFYLQTDTDTLNQLLVAWPDLGGGLEISFNQGLTWTRFDSSQGNPADSSTWLVMAGSAVASDQPDGQLDPLPPRNRAVLQLRLKAPLAPAVLGLRRFQLMPDFDVL